MAEATKDCRKAEDTVEALIQKHEELLRKRSDERNVVITQLDELRADQKDDQEAQRKAGAAASRDAGFDRDVAAAAAKGKGAGKESAPGQFHCYLASEETPEQAAA
eukprot:4210600-Heterocapsa_arctica.AAC.1